MDVGLVCDACSALTPIGVPQCARCGAAVALDPRTPRTQTPSRPPSTTLGGAAAGTPCPKCATLVGPAQKFCPSCGHRIPAPQADATFDVDTRVGPRPGGAAQGSGPTPVQAAKSGRSTLFFGGAHQAARAKLTLIRGDGEDGVSFTLAGQEHHAGRGDCPISFLSLIHI